MTYCREPLLGFLPSVASRFFGDRINNPIGNPSACLLNWLLRSSEIIFFNYGMLWGARLWIWYKCTLRSTRLKIQSAMLVHLDSIFHFGWQCKMFPHCYLHAWRGEKGYFSLIFYSRRNIPSPRKEVPEISKNNVEKKIVWLQVTEKLEWEVKSSSCPLRNEHLGVSAWTCLKSRVKSARRALPPWRHAQRGGVKSGV